MKWLQENYESMVNKISGINVPYKMDIFHESILYFIDNKKTKRAIEEGWADKLLMGIFKLNAYHKTAPYHQKYNKHKTCELFDDYQYEEDEHIETPCLADLEYIINGLDIFFIDKLMFQVYVDNKIKGSYSIRKLSEEVNLSHSTLSAKMREVKKIIN